MFDVFMMIAAALLVVNVLADYLATLSVKRIFALNDFLISKNKIRPIGYTRKEAKRGMKYFESGTPEHQKMLRAYVLYMISFISSILATVFLVLGLAGRYFGW